MAMCSLLGGMALANAKLGAVHGLAGVIGGTAEVPHGMACAALLAPAIEANVRMLRSGGTGSSVLDRYTEAAELLSGQRTASLEDGLAWIRETLALLHVPGLATFGIGAQQADEIAAKALVSSSMKGNPVRLSQTDLKAILLQALLPWGMARPVPRHGPRPAIGIRWEDLTEQKIAAIPLLAAQRPGPR